jgi:hypothetical protein
MRTHTIALAAVLGLATLTWAGELDREFKGADGRAPAATPAPTGSVTAGLARTELDDESPTQAGRYHGGWGWGHHGWGHYHGWGWGHHHGWGWGYAGWYRPYYGFYASVGYWPSYYFRPFYSYYYPAYTYSYYPAVYAYPGYGYYF